LANRSTATLSTVLITNRTLPDGEGYLIDVGTITPCTTVKLQISRSVLLAHSASGRVSDGLWRTGNIQFWDPVGSWNVSGGFLRMAFSRRQSNIEPEDRIGGLTESTLVDIKQVYVDHHKIFTQIPKSAETADDCS
jgi:hypothetical protein